MQTIARKIKFQPLQLGLLGIILLSSCIEKEIPAPPFERRGLTISQLFAGPNYENQIWYSLVEDRITGQVDRLEWDICFSTNPDAPWLKLNTSRVMQAAITNTSNFAAVTSDAGANFIHDFSSGFTDSLSAGPWWEHNKVILIDLGFTAQGAPLGRRKIKCSINGSTVTIQYGNINAIEPKEISLTLNNVYANNYVSLMNETLLQPEPPKGSYDLLFTNYTFQFWNPFLQYLVYGVFLADGAKAKLMDSNTQAKVAAGNWEQVILPPHRDAIGYNWKTFSFDIMAFDIHSDMEYLIRTNHGFFFTLRFVDFYNEQGVRGAPKFEFQQL
ncbi:MAG: HmuY family protein [Luteibaculaceae bacterium]